jgi:hypothetical protein
MIVIECFAAEGGSGVAHARRHDPPAAQVERNPVTDLGCPITV